MPPRESKMQISYKGETIWHGCWGQVMKIHGRSVMDVVHWPEVFDAVCFPVNLDDAYLNDFAFEIEGDVHLPFEVVLALAARPDEKPSAWITVDARPTRGPS